MRTVAEIALLSFLAFCVYIFQAPLIAFAYFLLTLFKYGICAIGIVVALFLLWVVWDYIQTDSEVKEIKSNLSDIRSSIQSGLSDQEGEKKN